MWLYLLVHGFHFVSIHFGRLLLDILLLLFRRHLLEQILDCDCRLFDYSGNCSAPYIIVCTDGRQVVMIIKRKHLPTLHRDPTVRLTSFPADTESKSSIAVLSITRGTFEFLASFQLAFIALPTLSRGGP